MEYRNAELPLNLPTEHRSLGLDEAAHFLKISPSALRAKVNLGIVPGAKIGKCWVFLQNDLVDHIRSKYPDSWQALRVQPMEKTLCYTNATELGGSDLPLPKDSSYGDLLGLPKK
ncbi:MAG: helix-turn-helix domain-containing protein [Gammaproteobacteria bacterium]|nr:helix-turn-helix domain-containing protein [Gammaproteobacteria bacterium]